MATERSDVLTLRQALVSHRGLRPLQALRIARTGIIVYRGGATKKTEWKADMQANLNAVDWTAIQAFLEWLFNFIVKLLPLFV